MKLRRAESVDAAAIAIVHQTAMRVSLSFLPQLHSLEDYLNFFAQRFLPHNAVWVAEVGGRIVGYIGFNAEWINHLYVLPDFQGQGVGPGLLDVALADGSPRRLWTFQENHRARRFYEARGFVLIELTDGAMNEEKTPDALYEWRG